MARVPWRRMYRPLPLWFLNIYILTHAFERQVFMRVFELLDFTDTELLSNSRCSLSTLNGRNFTEHFFARVSARLAFG